VETQEAVSTRGLEPEKTRFQARDETASGKRNSKEARLK
jgi:hypothetical protein